MDFSSIAAAQRWLDAQPRGWWVFRQTKPMNDALMRCEDDCLIAWTRGDWTALKMAARRLSSALSYHRPQTFG